MIENFETKNYNHDFFVKEKSLRRELGGFRNGEGRINSQKNQMI